MSTHVLASGRRGELEIVNTFCQSTGLSLSEGMGMLASGLVRSVKTEAGYDLVAYTANVEHLRAAARSYALLSKDAAAFEGEVPGVSFGGSAPRGWGPVWQWGPTNRPGAALDALEKCFANYGIAACDGVELLVAGKIRIVCQKSDSSGRQLYFGSLPPGYVSGIIYWPFTSIPEIHAALEEVRRGDDDAGDLPDK